MPIYCIKKFVVVVFLLVIQGIANGSNAAAEFSRRLLGVDKDAAMDLRLHKCKEGGEAYAAAWLTTRHHLIEQFTGYNLSWVNCEMASFIMMNSKANPDKDLNGSITMTLDVLDLSVIHLSAYERLQRRHSKKLKTKLGGAYNADTRSTHSTLDDVINASSTVQHHWALPQSTLTRPPRFNRTVVIMPFLASGMGSGHSVVSNRVIYLRACFWSFYAYYRNIVVFVKSEEDASYVRLHSGLPFYDILVLPNLPKMAGKVSSFLLVLLLMLLVAVV